MLSMLTLWLSLIVVFSFKFLISVGVILRGLLREIKVVAMEI